MKGPRRIAQLNLLALLLLNGLLCHCLSESPHILFSFFWILWKWIAPYYFTLSAVVRLIVSHSNIMTCYRNHFTFPSVIGLLLPVETSLSLQTSLLVSINPSSIKCSTIQLWDKGYGSFWTALPFSSQHHTDDQHGFRPPLIHWSDTILFPGDYKFPIHSISPSLLEPGLDSVVSVPLFAVN